MNTIFDALQFFASNFLTYGVTFLVVLSILVFVHEWGHYIVARLCGIRVETFSIGFGKEIFGFTDKKGTRWKFSLIPLGGYVKMFGDVDPSSSGHADGVEGEDGAVRPFTNEERKLAFFAKPVWARALVVFAGPAINFIFAIVILAILYGMVGKPLTPAVIMGMELNSNAEKSGFKPQDKVLSINGQAITSFDDVRREVMLALDAPLLFKVEREGSIVDVQAVPERLVEKDRFGFQHEKGFLGLIGPAQGLDITKILAVNGVKVDDKNNRVHDLLQKNLGQRTVLDMATPEMMLKTSDTPDRLVVHPPVELNQHLKDSSSPDYALLVLGVRPGDEVVRYSVIGALVQATNETGGIVRDTLYAMGQMINGTRSATELGGVIRIGAIAGDMAERGLIALVSFTALLSINLGLINLFPVPMLDGGHLAFYAIEAVKGSPLSERTQEYAFRFGLFVLVSLMFFANLNDILQILL